MTKSWPQFRDSVWGQTPTFHNFPKPTPKSLPAQAREQSRQTAVLAWWCPHPGYLAISDSPIPVTLRIPQRTHQPCLTQYFPRTPSPQLYPGCTVSLLVRPHPSKLVSTLTNPASFKQQNDSHTSDIWQFLCPATPWDRQDCAGLHISRPEAAASPSLPQPPVPA